MSSYPCSSLAPEGENIRLLRLLPNKDEAAALDCELHNHSLSTLDTRSHMYEALSYVWGDPNETLPINVNGGQIPVTVNLHSALLRLRDRSFERILWVDAICIDQSNEEERGQQVQLMAKIYSKAHRVIVWLGKEEADAKGALEDICLTANEELTVHSKKEINHQSILNLLRRPWFQRIWVLQEVAAARHVVMICGPMEIDGYAFCLGLRSLNLSYGDSPELQTLPSVIYLIERAGLRPKHITHLPERFSLGIRCLAELLDMFHTRKATDVRDKVYALLGMSSDDPGEANLRPDYGISWEELFQKLVKFVLGKDISVENSDYVQRPVIKSKGCILGQVSSVKSDAKQNVNIIFKSTSTTWCRGNEIEWTLQASAKSIQERDIVCLLQGALKPTVIRLYKDCFAIIIIAVTPLKESESFKELELSKSITRFPRDFLLVWDWEQLPNESQDREESNNWKSFDQATRTWNIALILEDLEEYEKAEKLLREAIKGYETVFGEEQSMLGSLYNRTPLSWAAENGYKAVAKLLLATGQVEVNSKDTQYGQTPLSWAAINGHKAVVKLLLATGQVEVDSKDTQYGQTPLSWAAKNGHEAVAKLLLATRQAEVDSKDMEKQTPLSWAAKNGHEAVAKLLLATGQVEVDSKNNYNRTPLSWAAINGHEAVAKLLLATGQVEVDSKDTEYGRTPLSWAAENGHEAVAKLLLATSQVEVDSKDKDNRTPLSYTVKNGHEAVAKLLVATGQVEVDLRDTQYGRTPLSWAARNGHEAVVKLLLATGQVEVDSKNYYNQTPLSWAARNGHEAVVKLLLATGQVEVDSKDKDNQTPLSWAATNGHEVVVKLLLATGQVEVDSKNYYNQTPLSWAARNGHEAVVKLLLATGQVEVDSKDKDNQTPLSWAARNGHEAVAKLLLATGQVEVDSKDNNNQTPLSWAALYGQEAVAKLLLATGQVEVDSKNHYNQTPLSWAALNGQEAVVKLLLGTGQVEVDSKDKDNQTPLSWAALYGQEAVVKLLLGTGQVEVDSKDKDNQTPLSWAAKNGHEAVVKLLLATGQVEVDSKNYYNQTPLSRAAENGHEAIAKLLREHVS